MAEKQTIVKIVLIETDISFCYIVVTKYGQVGIYDSQWRLLWSYIAILDEISAKGFYSAKKRHIKWITDVLYMADAEILVIATSARCLVFYDTSRLHHIPIWFVSGIRNIPQCMTYYYDNNKSILFFGDEYGNVFKIVWIQPKVALLPRKMKDRLSLYYWRELYLQPDYVSLSIPQKIHETKICNISYLPKNQTLITCCETRKRSLILTDLAGCMDSYIFNINRGVTAYFLELEREILVTGGNDTIIRVWNRFVTNKPMALLTGHNSKIVDVCINIVYEMIISLSEDGYLKVWNLTEYYCIQTLHLVFPSFSVLGKVVEWGSTRSIFPGPCLKQIKDVPKTGLETNCGKEIMSEQSQVGLCPSLNLRLSKMVSLETVQEVNENRENEWCRDNFVVICCNHIAILKLNRDSQKSEDGFYSAPHSYKEEVVPKSWKEILSKQLKKKTPTTINDLNEKQSVDQLDLKFRAKFNILEIMEKDDLFSSGAQCSINRQMLKLEQLKELMKPRVEICAPYTALKLNDLAEMKFSENIPLGRSRQQRRSMEKTTRLLATCNLTPIAANNLTDRSSKSSTNRSTFRSTTSSQFNLEFSNISK